MPAVQLTQITGSGLALEGLGLVVASWGLYRTFREAAPGESLVDPVRSRAVRSRDRLRTILAEAVRRLTRRPRQTIVGVGMVNAAGVAFRARARVSYGPLKLADLTAATRELERRSKMAWDKLTDLDEKVADEIERLDAADRAIDERLTERLAKLEADTRRVTVGDVRIQLVGLFLIGLGLILQTAGNVVG
jgi:hypothetical protein